MSVLATYSPTYLPNINKLGKAKADDRGYFRCIVGGFDIANESGKLYHYSEEVKALFAPGSILNRRMSSGNLRSEQDHPNIEGMPYEDVIRRLIKIDLDRVCGHFGSFTLESKKDHEGRTFIAVIGRIKPSGPFGDVLRASLENLEENTCFSVRSFTKPAIIEGRAGVVVTSISTYDYVNEGGIRTANKFSTLALESLKQDMVFQEQDFDKALANSKAGGIGTEADTSTITMMRSDLGWAKVPVTRVVTATDW